MAGIHETLSAQFEAWEKPGRGWQVWPDPVAPEPPFRHFQEYQFPAGPVVDDGRKPTLLSSLVQRLSRSLATAPQASTAPEPDEPSPEPAILRRDPLVELQLSLPPKFSAKPQEFAQALAHLALCREPVSFEIVGTKENIVVQLAVHPADVPKIQRQVRAYFPEAVITETEGFLANAWEASADGDTFIVEFGLGREFACPLARPDSDPFIGIVAALTELRADEVGLFQVTFQSVESPWADHLLRAVTDAGGRARFVNAQELARLAQEKITSPLFAVVVRLAARAENFDRAFEIVSVMTPPLRSFARLGSNELIPLRNDEYPFEAHCADVPARQCRRTGMLLNTDELIGFVHLPTAAVRSSKLMREVVKTKATPSANTQTTAGFLLGNNVHAGQSREVRLSPEERGRHMHLIGASGTGKSTLLFNLIRQDIENGEGVAVLDPHGDLVERILGIIPPERIGDVVLIDPADEAYSVGFNILSAHSDLEKTLLSSDLISVFQRLSTSWGDQMASVLQNAILAFLESSQGGTLSDLRRFLIEPAFRNQFLTTVRDPDVLYYWRKDFSQLTGNKSIGPVLTRLETFLAPKPIRYMVSQRENRIDFARIMDGGKIFLAKLAQGQIGKENAYLLGSLFVAKFQETAMARQAQVAATRRPFWLYLDEFHNFITPSMAEILTGARKYRLGLILAHQELRQLQRDAEVASAVLANPYTRICFRLGDDDARKLADGFSFFEAKDLQNLDQGQSICRLERSDADFNLSVPSPTDPDPEIAAETRRRVITASRERYATPRAEVEAALLRHLGLADAEPAEEPKVAEVRKHRSAEPPAVKPEVAAPATPEPPTPKVPPVSEVPIPAPICETLPPLKISVPLPETKSSEDQMRPAEPRDLGIGGAQHQIIQRRIKEAAEGMGFRATIEKQILDRAGSVDLFLERGTEAIACEITVTTTIDHEVGNVAKCLKAGVKTVAMICGDEGRLQKIADAVRSALGAEVTGKVIFQTPDGFIDHLRKSTAVAVSGPSSPATRTESVSRGRKVRSHFPKATAEERAALEDAPMNALSQLLRKKPH